MRATQCF